jgi:hypothetical protein
MDVKLNFKAHLSTIFFSGFIGVFSNFAKNDPKKYVPENSIRVLKNVEFYSDLQIFEKVA